jgi:uncharacterized protein (TIGR02246 family)
MNPILSHLEAYKAAVLAKDIDAFVHLYDADVTAFDTWGKWSYQGLEAWRGMARGWFESLGATRVLVAWEDLQIVSTPDLAVAHAFVYYRGMSAEGLEMHSMHNRLTWILSQKSGQWKIVHEHTSAPIDFETMKPNLLR